jgi:hypothetical protein
MRTRDREPIAPDPNPFEDEVTVEFIPDEGFTLDASDGEQWRWDGRGWSRIDRGTR